METRPPAKKAWTTTACVSALAIAAKALRNSLGPPIIVGSNWRPASAHSLPGRFLGQIYPLRYFANLLILLTTPAGFGTALAAATEFSFVISTDVRSARRSATTAASRIVACIGPETVRAVRSAIDADYRQDDDGCGLGVGVDIFAAARAHLIGKSDDLAHCKLPLTVRVSASSRLPARRLPSIKGLARLTVR